MQQGFINDPFSKSMLARKQLVFLAEELEVQVGSAEDVLLHKLLWNKITPSDRQLIDASGIAAVQGSNLDLDYLRHWAAQQGTAEVLEDVLLEKFLKKT